MRTLASILFLSIIAACLAETKDESKQKRGLASPIGHIGPTYGPPHLKSNVGVATSSVYSFGPASNVAGAGISSRIVAKDYSSGPAPSSVVYTQPTLGHGAGASLGIVAKDFYSGPAHSSAVYTLPDLGHGTGISSGIVAKDYSGPAHSSVVYTQPTLGQGAGISLGIVAKDFSPGPVHSSAVYTQPALGHGHASSGYISGGHSLGGRVVADHGSLALTSGLYSGGVSSGLQSNIASSGFDTGLGLGYASGFGYTAPVLPATSTTSHISIEQPVPVPVYHAVGVPVTRPVPYHVAHPYPVQVPKPVPVSVPHPVPVNVPRPYPVEVNRPYPVTIPRLVPFPVAHPVPVEVPSPYTVPSPYPVPVRQPYPVEIPVATPVVGISAATSGVTSSGFVPSAGFGGFSSFLSGYGQAGGSSYSAPITTSTYLGASSSSGKNSGNFQGAPLRVLSGGPSGEKWTGLLTNNYGSTAALRQGYGGSLLGGFHSSNSVGGSYRSAGGSFGRVGASFGTSSHRVKLQDDAEYYPYP